MQRHLNVDIASLSCFLSVCFLRFPTFRAFWMCLFTSRLQSSLVLELEAVPSPDHMKWGAQAESVGALK